MNSNRPYLIRALYEWIMDNGMSPYLLVKADENVKVPREYIEDGKIILNIQADAVKGLQLGNEFINFNARFGGTPQEITVPVSSVLAIYATENGKGLIFPEEDEDTDAPVDGDRKDGKQRPHLKVIK